MIAHILYVFTLILFLILFIFFVKKNRQISNGSESEENIRKYDFLFMSLFYLLMGANLILYIIILKQNNYLTTSFTSYGASFLFLFIFCTIEAGFIIKKYRCDRKGDNKSEGSSNPKNGRNNVNSIYTTALMAAGIVFSFLPSYVIFGIIQPNIDITSIPEIPMVVIISLIGVYQIAIALFRIFRKEKKDVSYISFIISIILIFVSCYCYIILLEHCFFPVVGMEGCMTVFGFTIIPSTILNFIVSKKVEKNCFKDKKQFSIKDAFLVLEITDIVEGIILPLASVLFCILNHFHLITA